MMNKKRFNQKTKYSIVFLCILLLTITIITGCSNKRKEEFVDLGQKEIEYQRADIEYSGYSDLEFELTKETFDNEEVDLKTYWNGLKPVKETKQKVKTGEEFYLNLVNRDPIQKYGYCLVDWGDGTWSYKGPYKAGVEIKIGHTYYKQGEYEIRASYHTLDSGKTKGWTKAQTIVVSGESAKPNYIQYVKPISSSSSNESTSHNNIIDNDNKSFWKSQINENLYGNEWVGLVFDEHYPIDTFEVKTLQDAKIWPQNISIEYTSDGGETWYSLPTYYYVYKYSEDRYNCQMGFPNPKGATLRFDLNGLVADGIRISSKMFPLDSMENEREFIISELKVTKKEEKLFYTSNGGMYDADINNMWLVYGSAVNEPLVNGIYMPNPDPFRSGCATITSTEWLDWDGQKFIWTNEKEVLNIYSQILQNTKIGNDEMGNYGYVWATIHSQKHLGEQSHYTYNPIFIIAARNYLMQNNNANNFLESVNFIHQSINDRIDKAMEYMLNVQKGEDGLMIITDPENDGTCMGKSSNYWDYYNCFGYKSAYENCLFYASLFAMADIEKYRDNIDKSEYYLELASKVKSEFNNTFWDNEKKRYIGSVDIEGNRHDFGFTFVNFYAMAYGLATKDKAKEIYEWLEGERIIESDTSTREDIYGKFIYSPRSNTLDMASTGPPYCVWDHGGQLLPIKGTLGGYGNQMQNGGTIFYTSHYDLLSRIKFFGPDNAVNRFEEILKEFHKDELRRFGYSNAGGYIEGVIGEFPESGLVPLTFLNGFLGVKTTTKGILVEPKLPSEWKWAGINEYRYNNEIYSIHISKKVNKAKIEKIKEKYKVSLPQKGKWVITKDNKIEEIK